MHSDQDVYIPRMTSFTHQRYSCKWIKMSNQKLSNSIEIEIEYIFYTVKCSPNLGKFEKIVKKMLVQGHKVILTHNSSFDNHELSAQESSSILI
ncbi:hypothetical protein HYD71_00855 [Mycoplasmopsis bovis]|nr:hypothetical protein [Mycoplasmopsis bovis]QQH49461.1 hypothetical protein HYD71_00855 [Mycoplasmopsis bovis]